MTDAREAYNWCRANLAGLPDMPNSLADWDDLTPEERQFFAEIAASNAE